MTTIDETTVRALLKAKNLMIASHHILDQARFILRDQLTNIQTGALTVEGNALMLNIISDINLCSSAMLHLEADIQTFEAMGK